MSRLLMVIALASCSSASTLGQEPSSANLYALYEQPGRMVRIAPDARLSLYCLGEGSPTVILETGFGGGAYYAWPRLHPLLGSRTRTCSYDRAGYGFSNLGSRFPRDVEHFVDDLHALLTESDEPSPYVLVGHSNGGLIIGAYANRYPEEVAGMVFLDAAVRLPGEGQSEAVQVRSETDVAASSRQHLASIRRCLVEAEDATAVRTPVPGDECIPSEHLAELSDALAQTVARWLSSPNHWRTYLSEAECNYRVVPCNPRGVLRPEAWRQTPTRVVMPNVSDLGDTELAAALGLPPTDLESIAAARQNRVAGEQRQARICEFSNQCRVVRLPTADHYVQRALPARVAGIIMELF